jgi:hypothetical protein
VLARLTGAVAASLVFLSVPVALAAGGLDRDAQRVYDDYRSDGRIEPCRHTVEVYRGTLEQIGDAIDEDEPAFRPATEAALEAREHESCDGDKPASSGNSSSPGSGSTSPGGTAQSVPGSDLPAPAAGDSAPVAPTDPPAGEGGGSESAAPVPPGTGGAPAPEGAAAPVPVAAAPGTTEQVLVNRPYEGTPLGLLIAAALLACALLAWLAAVAARRFGWGEERLAGTRHAWGEAAFRAGGTWSDFLDWVRVGR